MNYSVGVCICTFKRTKCLSNLLESLLKVFSEYQFITILVDNDKDGSAVNIYENFKNKLPLRYEVEFKQGLSNARNKCIDIAEELNLQYIVFLDDDEIIKRKDWLTNLINTACKENSDIVTGPVLPLYNFYVKGYIRKSGFFSSKRYKSGTKLPHTGTGNTLIKLSILSEIKPVFSEVFNISGGEDTYLFLQLVKRGNAITWCDEAEVFEYIPLERANISYIFKRSFYSSINFAKIEDLFDPNKTKRLLRVLKGMAKIFKGITIGVFSLFFGMSKLVQSINLVGIGLGDIAGVLGVNSNLYKI